MSRELIEKILPELFSNDEMKVFVVLDGASIPELLPMLDDYQPKCSCLFAGELSPDMAEVAPYLIQLDPDAEFTGLVIEKGWGNHWGIFLTTTANFNDMRSHFSKLTIVRDSQGRPLRFRFYDPRVLRRFLPTCNRKELTDLFGNIAGYFLEDEDPARALHLQLKSGALQRRQVALQ